MLQTFTNGHKCEESLDALISSRKHRTYLSIGHVSKDRLPDGNFTHGGSVIYSSVAARRFGWQPEIITACDSGFKPPDPLAAVCWHLVPSPVSTTFRNEYGPSGRTQTIEAVASDIGATQIPAQCRQAALVHLAPLAQEVDPAILSLFPDAFLVSTPQGWLREWDDAGAVKAARWPDAQKVLPQLEAAVVSIEDISRDWTIAETWASLVPILVVTQDEKGCTIFHQGKKEHVPPRATRAVAPTGAGDIFAATFFILLFETGNAMRSACLANIAASMFLENPGIKNVPVRDEVEAYFRQSF